MPGQLTPEDEKSTIEYPGWPGQEDWRAVEADLANKDDPADDDSHTDDEHTDESDNGETDNDQEGLDLAYRHMLESFIRGDNPPWPPAGEEPPRMVFCAPPWQEDIVSWDSDLDDLFAPDDVSPELVDLFAPDDVSPEK